MCETKMSSTLYSWSKEFPKTVMRSKNLRFPTTISDHKYKPGLSSAIKWLGVITTQAYLIAHELWPCDN